MLDLQESEPQDIGPRWKATTVHIMEQEAVKNRPFELISVGCRRHKAKRSGHRGFTGTFPLHES